MLKGHVRLSARMQRARFGEIEVNLGEPGVEHIILSNPDGERLRITVYVHGVASAQDGLRLAIQATRKPLERLVFQSGVPIGEPIPEDGPSSVFREVDPAVAGKMQLIHISDLGTATDPAFVTWDVQTLKAGIERQAQPEERHYGLFRSALNSDSPAEMFMHLYNVLLMLHKDDQEELDLFIVSEEAGVRQTPYPPDRPRRRKSKTGWMETGYTRRRNELGHRRAGVNIDDTKRDMANLVPGLVKLVKRAIELNR